MLIDRLATDVLAWVTGWCRARGASARLLGDHAVVNLSSPTRDREYIVVAPSESRLAELVRDAGLDDRTWITVIGPVVTAPGGLRLLSDTERFMGGPLTDPDPDAAVRISHHEGRVEASVLNGDRIVARGRGGLTDDIVVPHGIETFPDHRRQGHGRRVMRGLDHAASHRGARRGLLIASEDGRALYSALGWEVLAEVRTYCPGA